MLYVHEANADRTGKRVKLDVGGSFSEPHELAPGLEAFPLPGHTAGFTVYRWKGERGSDLFGGDVIFRAGLDRVLLSHRPYEVGVRSLYQLMDPETDYLLLNESLGDDRPPVPFGAKKRASAVGQALARVAEVQNQRLAVIFTFIFKYLPIMIRQS